MKLEDKDDDDDKHDDDQTTMTEEDNGDNQAINRSIQSVDQIYRSINQFINPNFKIVQCQSFTFT